MIKVKCVVSRYDETITKPPFKTLQIDEMEVYQPETDHLGEEFYDILSKECMERGYRFKFYTLSSKEGFKYNVVVY